MEISLLGPVEVRAAGQLIGMGGPRQRAVLAALAVDAGRPVPVETVIDRVWGEQPPERPRSVLYVYVARIRAKLARIGDSGKPRLVRQGGGYSLEVPEDGVDTQLFVHLVEQARAAQPDDALQARLLRRALDLWRGVPLANVPGEWAAQMQQQWERQRLEATLCWADAELRCGQPETILDELSKLAAWHPLSEPLAAALMRALKAAGRTVDALLCYVGIRTRLAEELGCDPGRELQELHLATLREAAGPAAPIAAETPAQLPPDPRYFVNRQAELSRLDDLLPRAGNRRPLGIVVLSGMAGVGKTALAVHWAHGVRHQFPDGQLYLNLRGFDPAGPMSAAEAVRTFLDALGVPSERVPATLEAQAGLLRSLQSKRRLLILLDNARNADQVRPLLPGAPGCLAIVTSRNPLRGLVSAEGADFLPVNPPSMAEARRLLALRLGEERIGAEHAAADDIICHCGRLPLAIAVVAGRAAIHADFPLAMLAGELSAAAGRLDALASDDPATDVRTVLSWSYRAISPPATRLFRLLGLHPGPDISAPAAASLAGTSLASAGPLLRELAAAHLIEEQKAGRYALHDLSRAYATELARDHEQGAAREAAVRRMLDHYLHTTVAADRLLSPQREAVPLDPPGPDTTLVDLPDHDAALAWLTTAHSVLLRVVEYAASTGRPGYAWRLAWALESFFQHLGHWHDQLSCQGTALAAAAAAGDVTGTAHTHRGLANAYARLGDYKSAGEHYRLAQAGFSDLGDRADALL